MPPSKVQRNASRPEAEEVLGHPTAARCYAWEVDGEVTAVLEEGPVDSARTAVRAAIMTGGKE